MAIEGKGQDWQTRLRDACNSTADTSTVEQAHYRSEAEKAPLHELRIFLDQPSGKYQHAARAVMREVLRQREVNEQVKAERQTQASTWRWGLAQQIIAGVVLLFAGILIGALFSR